VGAETVYLETLDGVTIETDVVRTEQYPARAVVIIAHPHPQYGGDRHNHVVRALQTAAAELHCHSIAVDFRGVGNSGGLHDNGDSERLDLAAACELADMIEPECPIVMAGYSFGSVVGLNVSNPFIAAWLAVAPPLPMMQSLPTAANNHRPKFLLAPEHDQFTNPAQLRDAVSTWANTTVIDLPGVDHFILADAPVACHQILELTLNAIA
jgi:alpha/beta superfamily hydrolase